MYHVDLLDRTATLAASCRRLRAPVTGQVKCDIAYHRCILRPAEIHLGRHRAACVGRLRKPGQCFRRVARPEKPNAGANFNTFNETRGHPGIADVHIKMAAFRRLPPQYVVRVEMRDKTLGNIEFSRQQAVCRGYCQHRGFQKLSLDAGHAAGIDRNCRILESLLFRVSQKFPEPGPDIGIDRSIMQQLPFELHAQRAHTARDDQRQAGFYAAAGRSGPIALQYQQMRIGEALPEIDRAGTDALLLELLKAAAAVKVINLQFAQRTSRRMVDAIDNFDKTRKFQRIVAMQYVQPMTQFTEQLETVGGQIGERFALCLRVGQRMIGSA